MIRRVAVLVVGFVTLASALAACGDDDGGVADPDAAVGDTTPPRVISTTPADGARRVSVLLQEIVFEISEPLDEDSVAAGIIMTTKYGQGVDATVHFDAATSSIVLRPARTLSYGAEYTVGVEGPVTDLAGNELAQTLVQFRTYANPLSGIDYYAAGTASGYFDRDLDDDGNVVGGVWVLDAGDDSTWRTADDVVSEAYRYATTKSTFDALTFDAPGTDGLWQTADDVVSGHSVSNLDEHGDVNRSTVYVPGDDGEWLTGDDEPLRYDAYRRTHGLAVRTTRFNNEGVDATWFTEDDEVLSYRAVDLDSAGRPSADVWYDGSGTDGEWFTADDAVGAYTKLTYDSAGNRLRFINYVGAGTDNVWFTADDEPDRWVEYSHDGDGLLVRETYYGQPGIDGVWLTSDDVAYYATNTAHDVMGNRVDATSYDAPGTDGVWHTGDDLVERISTFATDR